jgi:hypothetical protein
MIRTLGQRLETPQTFAQASRTYPVAPLSCFATTTLGMPS